MKESERNRLKYAVCESTLSTVARSPFPNGEGLRYENTVFLTSSKRIYVYVKKNNIDGQSLPRMGKVASGASRIGF